MQIHRVASFPEFCRFRRGLRIFRGTTVYVPLAAKLFLSAGSAEQFPERYGSWVASIAITRTIIIPAGAAIWIGTIWIAPAPAAPASPAIAPAMPAMHHVHPVHHVHPMHPVSGCWRCHCDASSQGRRDECQGDRPFQCCRHALLPYHLDRPICANASLVPEEDSSSSRVSSSFLSTRATSSNSFISACPTLRQVKFGSSSIAEK
jgi:hypothetical protein